MARRTFDLSAPHGDRRGGGGPSPEDDLVATLRSLHPLARKIEKAPRHVLEDALRQVDRDLLDEAVNYLADRLSYADDDELPEPVF